MLYPTELRAPVIKAAPLRCGFYYRRPVLVQSTRAGGVHTSKECCLFFLQKSRLDLPDPPHFGQEETFYPLAFLLNHPLSNPASSTPNTKEIPK